MDHHDAQMLRDERCGVILVTDHAIDNIQHTISLYSVDLEIIVYDLAIRIFLSLSHHIPSYTVTSILSNRAQGMRSTLSVEPRFHEVGKPSPTSKQPITGWNQCARPMG